MQSQSVIPEITKDLKDEVKESSRSSLEAKRKDLEKEVKELTQEMTRLRRINRNWDGIDEQDKKIATGIIGGVIVAIQSIGNAFPVKQRAGAYRILQAQANNLLTDVKYVEGTEELKALESQFYLLRSDAAKTES